MKYRCLLLILLLAFMLCGAAHGEEADPVVVRVGDISFTQSVAEFAMNATLDVADAYNGDVSDADRIAVRDQTIERLIGIGVIENKLAERGMDDFTADEREIMMSEARSRYEETWQALRAAIQSQDQSITDEEITDWLTAEGYTVEAFYREALVSERQFRIIDLYCADVTVTADEVERFYQDTYVAPEREKYEDDIAAYEQDAIIGGDETFYTPEGYRYVKQILLDYPEDFQAALQPYERKAARALNAARTAYVALADAAAKADSWEDIAPFKAEYDAAMAAYQAANLVRREKQTEALPLLKDTTDEIAERYAAGVLFESLIEAYSADQTGADASDPGMLFHPDSPNWDERFSAAASALEKPGDISEPVATESGVSVIRYMGDVPGGVHELTAEERSVLEQAALYSARLTALQALIEDWQGDYDIEVHPERIDVD